MKNSLKANIGYAEIFATYWMSYCVIASFCSVFMLAHGYTNTEIGILIAIGNLVSVVMQPILANMADRSKRMNVFEISAAVTILIILFAVFTLLLQGRSMILFIAYVLMFALHAALQPLLNSMNGTLAYRGIGVDYGICRAMGSLGYSAVSALLSYLVVSVGIIGIPATGEVSALLLLIGLIYVNRMYKKAHGSEESGPKEASSEVEKKVDGEITMSDFIKRHALFLVMTVGIFLIYYDHQIINFFMLQLFKNVGGGSTEMGTYYSIMTVLEIIPLFGYTWLSRKFSTHFLLKLATIGFVLRAVLMLLAHTPFTLLLTLVVHPIGFPLFLPTIVKYINEIMDAGEAVRGQSLYVMVITVSAVIASSTGGVVLDSMGAGALLWICAVTCVIGAVVILPLVDRAK